MLSPYAKEARTGTAGKRVMLVNAPSAPCIGAAGNYALFAALGVVCLGTRLRKDYPDLTVKVADGGVLGYEEIKARVDEFKPDLLGISVITPTYSEGVRLAKHAKNSYGSIIVLGNDHASFFPETILHNNRSIDYVVRAEMAEEALSCIVSKVVYGNLFSSQVAGDGETAVYFRSGERIEKVNFPKLTMSQVYGEDADIPDLGLIKDELGITTENFNNAYGHFHNQTMTPSVINNVRGCGNGELRCTYCSIFDLGLNAGSPEFFWKTVKKQNDEYGINFFFEVCDSFLTFQKYVKGLLDCMPFNPKERGIEFEVYTRANDLVNVKDGVAWLKALNVTRVNVGIDSGDDNMLRFLRKNNSDRRHVLFPAQINFEAVRRLSDAGITFHLSFPLGSLGETPESLSNTINFIDGVAREFGDHLATLEASALIPLPNSPSWDMLLSKEAPAFAFMGGLEKNLADAGIVLSEDTKRELRYKYDNKDLYSTHEAAHDWVRHFTHITWNDIEKAVAEIQKIAGNISTVRGILRILVGCSF